MNEIQAVKTAKIEEVKKNSKKGFTLVELVVVIAILAILAAIAIPVVSSTIASSQRSSALSDAQTLELALKEAHAQIIAKDTSVYTDAASTTVATVVSKSHFKASKFLTHAQLAVQNILLSGIQRMINAIGWIVAVRTLILQSLLVELILQKLLRVVRLLHHYSDFGKKYAISVLLMTDNIQAKGSPSASLLKYI